MDKQKNGNTITIKINGKHGPFKDDKQEEPPNKHKKAKERVEQHSEHTVPIEQESAAAKESTEEGDTFDWILPSGNTLPKNEESKIVHLKDKKKEKLTKPFTALLDKTNKTKKVQLKTKGIKNINITMLLSIIFAVILGTFFGIILLKLVPSDQVVGGEEKPAVVNEQAAEQPIPNAGVEVTLKPISTVVIQEGVYSSQTAAEDILTALKEKGTPAAILPTDGKFAIFVGVADTVTDAKTIGKQIQGSEMTTFSKEFTIGEKKASLQHDEEKKLLELSPQLFNTLKASATTAGISNSIPAAAMENVIKDTAVLSEIEKDKLQNKAVIDIYSQFETAVAQIKQYEKKPEASTLNKIQQSLLSFMAAYASL